MNDDKLEKLLDKLDDITLNMSYYIDALLLSTDNGNDMISSYLVNFFVLKIDAYLEELREYI